jgi:hypothetical protein
MKIVKLDWSPGIFFLQDNLGQCRIHNKANKTVFPYFPQETNTLYLALLSTPFISDT